jgi:nucleoside-diphosphate-sugar epimerase
LPIVLTENSDFNLDVQAFANGITSTRRLVDLAATSLRGARVLFSSSIAVASNWNTAKGMFPEEVQPHADPHINTGYGESKFIAEQVKRWRHHSSVGTNSFLADTPFGT